MGGKRVAASNLNSGQAASPLTVPPGANSIAVEFAALDYSAPQRNRYAYRLDGFDCRPSPPEISHKVLPLFHGEFTIRTIFLVHPGIDLVEYPKVIGWTHEI